MHFIKSAAATIVVLSTGVLAAALPTELVSHDSDLLIRATPSTNLVTCGQIPGNPPLKKREVHVWQKVNPVKTNYRDPAGKVGFHEEINALQDVIGGSHYDVLFGTVGDNGVIYYEVGLLISDKNWVKTNPSGKGAPTEIYRATPTSGVVQAKGKPTKRHLQTREHGHDDDGELDAQLATLTLHEPEQRRDLAARDAPKCYYKGVIKAGSSITSPTMAQTKAVTKFGGQKYEIGKLDCTIVTDWILSQITFK